MRNFDVRLIEEYTHMCLSVSPVTLNLDRPQMKEQKHFAHIDGFTFVRHSWQGPPPNWYVWQETTKINVGAVNLQFKATQISELLNSVQHIVMQYNESADWWCSDFCNPNQLKREETKEEKYEKLVMREFIADMDSFHGHIMFTQELSSDVEEVKFISRLYPFENHSARYLISCE